MGESGEGRPAIHLLARALWARSGEVAVSQDARAVDGTLPGGAPRDPAVSWYRGRP